jgi:hypothetical protein
VKGDVEKFLTDSTLWPKIKVEYTPDADYPFRAYVLEEHVMFAMDYHISRINYPNFKDSVKNKRRLHAYTSVWHVLLNQLQTTWSAMKQWP